MLLKSIVSIVLCLAVGFLGSFFTRSSLDTWYAGLKKPVFNPPSWIFAPVWTALYVLIGFSAALVWEQGLGKADVRLALIVFLIQLFLNFLWSPAFFGRRSSRSGLVVIVLLWLAILATTTLFFGISCPAALLLLPYLAWVSFAMVLNASIAYLNK